MQLDQPYKIRSVWDTNQTLRNTFLLLTLTLIPTLLGVFGGIALNVSTFMTQNPLSTSLLFLGVMFGLIYIIHANPKTSLFFVLLFTGVTGLFLSGIVDKFIATKDGQIVLAQAIIGTIVITFSCAIYAMVTKRDFVSFGGGLFIMLIALIVVSIINMFLQLSVLSIVINIVAIVLFSIYLIYDVQRIVQGGETNYVHATLALYLDIINIFVNILSLFGMNPTSD